jgi:hypothetical protein
VALQALQHVAEGVRTGVGDKEYAEEDAPWHVGLYEDPEDATLPIRTTRMAVDQFPS